MSSTGWHPDPSGRASSRYFDGTSWTEHVTDHQGRQGVDPLPGSGSGSADVGSGAPSGAGAPAAGPGSPQIGAPPPRPGSAPEPEPAPAPAPAPAWSPSPAAAPAAAPSWSSGPTSSPSWSPADSSATSSPAVEGTSPLGLAGAGLGFLLGLLSLFVLDWSSSGDGGSFGDVRQAFDDFGPDFGALALGLVISGAYFAVFGGAVVAFARALGPRLVRIGGLGVTVLVFLVCSVLGLAAISVDVGGAGGFDSPPPSATPGEQGSAGAGPAGEVPEAGSPITDPTGNTIIDPSTGAPITVPDLGQDTTVPAPEASVPGGSTSSDLLDDAEDDAEGRLAGGAILAIVVMLVATGLAGVGLLLRGRTGRILAAAGLGVVTLWAVGATLILGGKDDVDLGIGPWVLVLATIVLAVSCALPPPRRQPA